MAKLGIKFRSSAPQPRALFLYSISIANGCPRVTMPKGDSVRRPFSGKVTITSSTFLLSLELGACLIQGTELPTPGARALLVISDASLIIALPKQHNLSSQVWRPINNPLGTGGSVPDAALSRDLSLIRGAHNQHSHALWSVTTLTVSQPLTIYNQTANPLII